MEKVAEYDPSSLGAGSAKIFVDGALRTEAHKVLCITFNQPCGLSIFVCEMEQDFRARGGPRKGRCRLLQRFC